MNLMKETLDRMGIEYTRRPAFNFSNVANGYGSEFKGAVLKELVLDGIEDCNARWSPLIKTHIPELDFADQMASDMRAAVKRIGNARRVSVSKACSYGTWLGIYNAHLWITHLISRVLTGERMPWSESKAIESMLDRKTDFVVMYSRRLEEYLPFRLSFDERTNCLELYYHFLRCDIVSAYRFDLKSDATYRLPRVDEIADLCPRFYDYWMNQKLSSAVPTDMPDYHDDEPDYSYSSRDLVIYYKDRPKKLSLNELQSISYWMKVPAGLRGDLASRPIKK